MRFALVNDRRTPPLPGLHGFCPVCGDPTIPKCGTQRIHHWAHSGTRVCDIWWERETQWHRDWKMHFPSEWQEVIRHAPSGEKHIADIHTEHGLTIEFQHSYLRPDERAAREDFYGEMVWVADGLRLVRDLPRFQNNMAALRPAGVRGIYVHRLPAELFPRSWLNCKAPVYFDFGEAALSPGPHKASANFLWGLLPQRILDHAVVLRIPREQFIQLALETPKLLLGHTVLPKVERFLPGDVRRRERQSVLEWRQYLEEKYPAQRRRRF